MSNRLAIFDCDGTLVDSQANIVSAMRDCFEEAGLPAPDPGKARRIVGLSVFEAMQAMLPDADHETHLFLSDSYKRAFHRLRASGLVDEPLYGGIAEILEQLEDDGWLLGVATGKSDRGLNLCLDTHGLHPRFVTLQTADRHPSKPHPSMIEQAMADAGATHDTTMMIGDTMYDIRMAKAAGVAAVGVSWGYHDPEELLAAGADYIAHAPADIFTFTKALA